MSRPVRIEFPNAVYLITSRGGADSLICKCDADRKMFLSALSMVAERYGWLIHGWVLMDDHYQLVAETPKPNLSKGMRQLNGVYTQYFNRSYKLTGSLFNGRFKSIVLEKEYCLVDVCRHVVLEPVRAGKVKSAERYRWSNYRSTAGKVKSPVWMNDDWVLSRFGRVDAENRKKYRHFVKNGIDVKSPLSSTSQQVLLGSDNFLQAMKPLLDGGGSLVKRRPRRVGRRRSLKNIFTGLDHNPRSYRNELICNAHIEHDYTLTEIGDYLGLHYTTVSKVVNAGK